MANANNVKFGLQTKAEASTSLLLLLFSLQNMIWPFHDCLGR